MTPNICWGKTQGVVFMVWSEESVRVAVPNIHDELLLEKVRAVARRRVIPEEHSPQEIRQMQAKDNALDTESILKEMADKPEATWESEPVINLVDSLLDQGLEEKATDIHLEPGRDFLKVRFRIDGLLKNFKELPRWLQEPVMVRLKLLADLDITERRLPHDGRFSFKGWRHQADVRVSTLPTKNGEKCVLRLLPSEDNGKALKDLGFSEKTFQKLQQIFRAPQGLFLITGPTGSGKTTTLYAGLREILPQKINITTIEDPIEYELQGVNQVQVNEKCGFTFATALRSILRQDPDVILIGEIRDSETAQIALRAAQTGHLVLATLHTNSAAAAFSRLEDLGIDSKILRESLLGILAQRLLRLTSGGRTAVCELLLPDSTYADENLRKNAEKYILAGTVTTDEVKRVLG